MDRKSIGLKFGKQDSPIKDLVDLMRNPAFQLLVVLCLGLPPALADVIENISAVSDRQQTKINIDLSRRMTYLSHTPLSEGELLTVRFQVLDPLDALPQQQTNETFPWRSSRRVPLTEVNFRSGVDGRATISLRFQNPVRYQLINEPNGSRFSILVDNAPAAAKASAASDETQQTIAPVNNSGPAPVLATSTAATQQVGNMTATLDQKMAAWLEQGKTAIIQGDYAKAITAYRLAAQTPLNAKSPLALEYLGMANELAGNLDEAKTHYQSYIDRFKKSKDLPRVRQRLQSLLTADKQPRKKLRQGNRSPGPEKTEIAADQQSDPLVSHFYGSFSNFYNGFLLMTDRGTEMVQSTLQADLFLSGQIQKGDWNLRGNFSGGQLYDTLGSRSPGNFTRINKGYLDLTNENWGWNLRLGRQNGYNGGVLGRFDGINTGYLINDKLRLNAVIGFPVEYARISRADQFNVFYGVNADLLNLEGPLDTRLDFNIFFIQQFVEDIQDRMAVGGNVRAFSDNFSLFSQIDYDLLFDSLNILSFNGWWRLPTNSSVNLLLDYRRAPVLTAGNALLGGFGATNVDQLRRGLSAGQVRDIAKRNSANSWTGTIGINHPLSDTLQVGAEFTATRLGAIADTFFDPPGTDPVFFNVEGIRGTGWEYFASAQVLANDLIRNGDLLGLSLRYAYLQNSDRVGVLVNSRLPLTPNFDIQPRFRVDYRIGQQNVNDWTFAPSIRLRYQLRKGIQLEADIGGEVLTRAIADNIGSFTEGNLYFLVGYRVDFGDL